MNAFRTLNVIIPVRNGGATLGPLLADMTALAVPEGWKVEVIVGYQASTDDTLAVAKAHDVQIVEDRGIGPAANRNAAVAASQGELLYFIDADARPVGERFFHALINAAETSENLGALGGPILLAPEQRWNPIALADHYASWFCWHHYRKSGLSNFQPSVNLLVPRAVFEQVGGFNETMHVLEDFDLQCRIKANGRAIYFDQRVAVTHRARGRLLASWRHSWSWGLPVRHALYQRMRPHMLFVTRPRLFWINGPVILLRRLIVVFVLSMLASPLRTIYCLPFLLATVFAWALAVAVGDRRKPVCFDGDEEHRVL